MRKKREEPFTAIPQDWKLQLKLYCLNCGKIEVLKFPVQLDIPGICQVCIENSIKDNTFEDLKKLIESDPY